MEYFYNQFIPIWLVVGKYHYYEIGLSQIEELYARIPFHSISCFAVGACEPNGTKMVVPWLIGPSMP
jgi:hypothetical protein